MSDQAKINRWHRALLFTLVIVTAAPDGGTSVVRVLETVIMTGVIYLLAYGAYALDALFDRWERKERAQ